MIRFTHWVALCVALLSTTAGWALERDVYIPKSESEAAETIARANAGNAEAQYTVGMTYRLDSRNPDNMKLAVEWLQKSANQNYAPAQNTLGMLYARGTGVPKDEKRGFEWVQKAANQSDAIAQYNLAIMYFAGIGVAASESQGASLLQKAAAQGQPDAQLALGDLMREGTGGVRQDRNAALNMYRKAADSGLAEAMFRYGIVMGEEKDKRKEAAVWIEKAANKNYPEAQFMVGMLAYDPEGATHDVVSAYQWFTLSLNSARDENLKREVREALAELEKEMTPQQIKQAKDRAQAWRPKA